jgi:hypothetical protein
MLSDDMWVEPLYGQGRLWHLATSIAQRKARTVCGLDIGVAYAWDSPPERELQCPQCVEMIAERA